MTDHPKAIIVHTAGTAGTVLVSLACLWFGGMARYTERFDFLFLIFWPVCVISSFYLLQDSDRTRSYVGFGVALVFGILFFATPRIME